MATTTTGARVETGIGMGGSLPPYIGASSTDYNSIKTSELPPSSTAFSSAVAAYTNPLTSIPNRQTVPIMSNGISAQNNNNSSSSSNPIMQSTVMSNTEQPSSSSLGSGLPLPTTFTSSAALRTSILDDAFLLRQEKKKLEILEKERDKLKGDLLIPDDNQEESDFKKTRLAIIENLIEDQKINIQIKTTNMNANATANNNTNNNNNTVSSGANSIDDNLQNRSSQYQHHANVKSCAADTHQKSNEIPYQSQVGSHLQQQQLLKSYQDTLPKDQNTSNLVPSTQTAPANTEVTNTINPRMDLTNENPLLSNRSKASGTGQPTTQSPYNSRKTPDITANQSSGKRTPNAVDSLIGSTGAFGNALKNNSLTNAQVQPQQQQSLMRQTYDNYSYPKTGDSNDSLQYKDKNKDNMFRTYDNVGGYNGSAGAYSSNSVGVDNPIDNYTSTSISLARPELTLKDPSQSIIKPSQYNFDSPLSRLLPKKTSSSPKKVEFDLKSNQEIIIENTRQYNINSTLRSSISNQNLPRDSLNGFQDQDIQVKISEIRDRLEHYEKLLKESFERNNENERKIQQYENVIQQMRLSHQTEIKDLKEKNQKLLDEISHIRMQQQQELDRLVTKKTNVNESSASSSAVKSKVSTSNTANNHDLSNKKTKSQSNANLKPSPIKYTSNTHNPAMNNNNTTPTRGNHHANASTNANAHTGATNVVVRIYDPKKSISPQKGFTSFKRSVTPTGRQQIWKM